MNEQTNISNTTRIIALGAVIAAVYAALTYLTAPISFSAIQFRVSEAFCILPVFTAAAVPGVTVGCFLANFLAGAAPMDVVFGTLATFIGAIGTRALRKAGPPNDSFFIYYDDTEHSHRVNKQGKIVSIIPFISFITSHIFFAPVQPAAI